VAAEVFGRQVAQEVQLVLEYCPAPPISGGSPKTAPADVVKSVIAAREGIQTKRRAIAERAATRLGLPVG
jgi:cyclohexyl-isocyanide hydratase